MHARTVDWKSTFDLDDDSSVPYVPPPFTPPRLPRLTTEGLFVRTKGMGVDEHGKVFSTFKSSPSSLLFNLGIVEQSVAVCLDDMIDKIELRSSVKVKTREGQLQTEEEEREEALRKVRGREEWIVTLVNTIHDAPLRSPSKQRALSW